LVQLLLRKERGENNPNRKTTIAQTTSSMMERGEIQGSDGMKWRMTNNQVELQWLTSVEPGNQGFIIEKRPSYGGDFVEVASFREVGSLVSKGPNGGNYRYLDPSTSSGSWIYRVKDLDGQGIQNLLCQCFVEVETEQEAKGQLAIAVGLAAILGTLFTVGFILDPPQ
jgi:hypothetical protein